MDQDSQAFEAYEKIKNIDPTIAQQLYKIASIPQAQWIGGWDTDIQSKIDTYVSAATAAQSVPVLVAYNIPVRDCGGYSSGGANSVEEYKSWINKFHAGINNRKAVILFEPDGLGHLNCLSIEAQQTRFSLYRYALDTFAQNPNASVYIETSMWVDPATMSSHLNQAGIEKARGVVVNVSAYNTTETGTQYIHKLKDALGREIYGVIDTSRNGLGPAPNNEWCNPPGRALGHPSSAHTTDPIIDAYYWVKRPGESDGECNGGPSAGTWWQSYAIELAQRAPNVSAPVVSQPSTTTPTTHATSTPSPIPTSSSTPRPSITASPTSIPTPSVVPTATPITPTYQAEYRDNSLFSNHAPQSSTKIRLFAAGTQANGVYPSLDLILNDQHVMTFNRVQGNPFNRSFKEYVIMTRAASSGEIKVAFTNDAWINGNDRNVMIDKVIVNGKTIESETPSIYSEGSWNQSSDCRAGFKSTEWLHCNGHFLYRY